MGDLIRVGPLTAHLRECWVLASDLRQSSVHRDWTSAPTLHALVIETVTVEEEHRRQGHFARFLTQVCAEPGFDLVIVEGVQNQHLAEYLLGQGWDFDEEVMDFYWKK